MVSVYSCEGDTNEYNRDAIRRVIRICIVSDKMK